MASKKKPGTELATTGGNAVAVDLPDYLKGFKGPTGTEGIESTDISIPRIKIGQSTSEEVKSGQLAYGDLFLNITKEVLAKAGKALSFVVVARGKEFILWRPRKDNGGGILARAKPVKQRDGSTRYAWDKPNTEFEVKIDGKTKVTWKTKTFIDQDGLDQWGSEIPGQSDSGIAATAHHNYVVVLPEHGDLLAALSLSKSQAKKAKDFNAMLKLTARGGAVPISAMLYKASTVDESNDQGDFKNYKFDPAGLVGKEQFARYHAMQEAFTDKVINVDQTDGGDDDEGGNKAL